LLGDLGRDIPSSYFAICDMAYRVRPGGGDSDWRDDSGQLALLINRKGLLAINPDRTIHHVKESYRAVQHVTAVFDDRLQRIADYACEISGAGQDDSFSVFAYQSPEGKQVATIWRTADPPGQRPQMDRVTLILDRGRFADPVWVDMLTGGVYEFPQGAWRQEGSRSICRDLPVYDSVVLIADRSLLPLAERPGRR
jgi:hypothetical protein